MFLHPRGSGTRRLIFRPTPLERAHRWHLSSVKLRGSLTCNGVAFFMFESHPVLLRVAARQHSTTSTSEESLFGDVWRGLIS